MPLLIHGDAAFAGQGVVAECFGLSGLRGHRTGGSVHFIVNNQIGFTTYPRYSRSSPYPSDVAKMIEAPIFHVNGDDPEAVVYAAKVATEFRQKFQKPVVIDMFCYRRFGHNEGDEPAFTQPLMYKAIRAHPTTLRDLRQAAGRRRRRHRGRGREDEGRLARPARRRVRGRPGLQAQQGRLARRPLVRHARPPTTSDDPRRGNTGVAIETLKDIGKKITAVPEGFHVHRTIQRFLDDRAQGDRDRRGHRLGDRRGAGVRLAAARRPSGAPVRPGLRARHLLAAPFGADRPGERGRATPRSTISATSRRRFEVINSMLSEEAVLGFEYGYSLAEPNALTLWEAQFGDFANGAQVVFDQFISSGERKWLRMSGLVCLLPHGYEGQGPEHSSARLERFLQMCAEDNMQVANCTTPANYFHILRRQLKRDFRKPLILMTPKSLLRHKRAVSRLDEMGAGHLVPPPAVGRRADCCRTRRSSSSPDDKIRRVVLCSGKVYYDLYEEREKRGIDDIYLLRVEQLYPFPLKALVARACRASSRPRWSGARKSRRTWAPGPSSSPISNGCSTQIERQDQARRAMPAARPRPRPRPA